MIFTKHGAGRIVTLSGGTLLMAIASPAIARRNAPYVMVEAGITDLNNTYVTVTAPDGSAPKAKRSNWIDFHTGQVDAGMVAGYDFGNFRAEGEVFYRRTRIHRYYVIEPTKMNNDPYILPGQYPDATGVLNTYAAMANGLVEYGGNKYPGVYAGLGAGVARVGARHFRIGGPTPFINGYRTRPAWQAIAGIRVPLFMDLEIGLKYRYLQTSRLKYKGNFDRDFHFRIRSHSALVTFGYNFR